MTLKPRSMLDEMLEAWAYTRQGVIAEVRNLSDSSLDFRPSRETRTTREIVQHVIESGLLMSGELSRPDGDFLRKSYPALLKEHGGGLSKHRTKASLLAALKHTHEEGDARLRAAGEIALLQRIRQFNGQPAMRLTWMHHGIAHEEYHRGQIALYARLMGRVPALTQLIQGV